MLYTTYIKIKGKNIIVSFIDLFFLILCLGTIYVSISRGLLCEIFKVVGLLLGAFAAFHFYLLLSIKISGKMAFLKSKFLYLIAFFLIFFSIRMVFTFLRLIVSAIIKKKYVLDEKSYIDKTVLIFIGGARGAFFSSVIFFILFLSPLDVKYFNKGISYGLFKNFAPESYLAIAALCSKFNPQIELNEEVRNYSDFN